MRTRAEAVELVHRQLDNETKAADTKTAWHYGKLDLRELLDFIYESKPQADNEKV